MSKITNDIHFWCDYENQRAFSHSISKYPFSCFHSHERIINKLKHIHINITNLADDDHVLNYFLCRILRINYRMHWIEAPVKIIPAWVMSTVQCMMGTGSFILICCLIITNACILEGLVRAMKTMYGLVPFPNIQAERSACYIQWFDTLHFPRSIYHK